ncbi:30786_t:CDS:2, partial [Racocetra persica]
KESKNIKSSDNFILEPEFEIFKKDINLNINRDSNKLPDYIVISSDDNIQQFLDNEVNKKEKNIKLK